MRPYYYTINEYLKDTYNDKFYKLSLNGRMSCPNRDGLISSRGCIFCSPEGSGDFSGSCITGRHFSSAEEDLDEQINAAKQLISSKYNGNNYIAYFQAFTNTYADISYLRRIFMHVINKPEVRILSIATRPDCLNNNVLMLLDELNKIKPVWIELGLQTIHEKTADYIRRGYPLEVFDDAMFRLKALDIKTIVHMIIGLPFETREMITETARYIGNSGAWGIKLQLLHILKNTDLAKDYEKGLFKALSLDEYTEFLSAVIPVLPKEMVVHRITGDGPKSLLIAPEWSRYKKRTLNSINHHFAVNNIIQGRYSNE